MKLRIECYSKKELGIELIYPGNDEIPKGEVTELITFNLYALRQFTNLGEHPVAKALDSYLVSKQHFDSLIKGKPVWPTAPELISDLLAYLDTIADDTAGSETLRALKAAEPKLELNKTMLDLLDEKILTPMPIPVETHGGAKKWFELTVPSGYLEMIGFGGLFGDLHYYTYQSVLALARYLGTNHKNDITFQTFLSESAALCSVAHILKQISLSNQMELALAISDKVGAIKHYQDSN